MRPSQILEKHRSEIRAIMARYPTLANLRVVGSVARGEDTEKSDIDFLVDPLPGTTLFKLGGLYEDFQALLGVPVHITLSDPHMKKSLKMTFERDSVPI